MSLAVGLAFAAGAQEALPAGVVALEVQTLAQEPVSLTGHFGVLEDPGGGLTIAEVTASAQQFRFGHAPAWSLDFGVTNSAIWLQLPLKNAGTQHFEGMLEFTYPRLASSVQLFAPAAQGGYTLVHTGYARPFSERAYPHHFYVFPLTLDPGEQTTLWLRFQSDIKLEIPGRLWQRSAFHRYERVDYVSHALYFGMVMAMMGFNLLLFVVMRNARFFWYVCFGTSTALSIAAIHGLAVEYLWPNAAYWTNISAAVGYSLTLVFGILFMRSMIRTRVLIPRLDLALRAALVLHLLLPLGLAVSYLGFIKLQLASAALTALLVMYCGVVCAIKRDRSAMFFSAAFAVMAAGAIANSLRALGLIETTFFSTHGIQIGSAMEMLLLAFALADFYNTIRKEKTAAQREMLSAQSQLVVSLQQSERQLESRVAERTAELNRLNAKLEALSTTDALTGLANRRRFDEVLHAEWRRCLRIGQPMAVGILDVDWFKKYNDHYGHLAGDACLQQVARTMALTICRTGDLAARFGGEEFAFIAPGVDPQGVLAMAHRLCAALEEARCEHAGSTLGWVTASIGVASVVPTEAISSLELLNAADEALYQAKHQGRNRAVLSHFGAPKPL